MSSEWDEIYSKRVMAIYPDNQLIRFVANNYYGAPNRKDVKFLDVGCGAGGNTWYLAKEGFSVAAIDSSPIAMERLRLRLEKENLEAFLGCGDITQLELKENYFDAIIDVSSLCYVPDDKIQPLLKGLKRVLKPGGKLFSIAPTYYSVREPFTHVVDGVETPARFLDVLEVQGLYGETFNIKWATCSYPVKAGRVELWIVEGVKDA